MQPKMLHEISKINSLFHLQSEMADTNFALAVITVNEVSTLLCDCEYHSWLLEALSVHVSQLSWDGTAGGAFRMPYLLAFSKSEKVKETNNIFPQNTPTSFLFVLISQL